MCRIRTFFAFFRNGIKVFRLAAHGQYQEEEEALREIEEEIRQGSSWKDDKTNLQQDSKKVRDDMQKSWNKISASNG